MEHEKKAILVKITSLSRKISFYCSLFLAFHFNNFWYCSFSSQSYRFWLILDAPSAIVTMKRNHWNIQLCLSYLCRVIILTNHSSYFSLFFDIIAVFKWMSVFVDGFMDYFRKCLWIRQWNLWHFSRLRQTSLFFLEWNFKWNPNKIHLKIFKIKLNS